jgi:membrane protease YdiL (CAAX protease family)
MTPELTVRLVLIGLYSAVVLALFVAVPIVAWRARPLPEGTLRQGAAFAILVLALQLPALVVYPLYYDPGPLLEDELAPPLVHALSPDLAWAMFSAGLGSAALLAAWRVLVWPVATVMHERPAFPWLRRGEGRPWGSALALGLGLGLLGVALDLVFGGGPDTIAREAPDLFPGLPDSWPTRLALGATGGVAAALSEELLFRGVLQRALLRWLPVAGAIALAAGVAACGHALTPHLPWLDVVRAGGFATALGVLAHRHGLECSLLAHTVLAMVLATGTLLS